MRRWQEAQALSAPRPHYVCAVTRNGFYARALSAPRSRDLPVAPGLTDALHVEGDLLVGLWLKEQVRLYAVPRGRGGRLSDGVACRGVTKLSDTQKKLLNTLDPTTFQ